MEDRVKDLEHKVKYYAQQLKDRNDLFEQMDQALNDEINELRAQNEDLTKNLKSCRDLLDCANLQNAMMNQEDDDQEKQVSVPAISSRALNNSSPHFDIFNAEEYIGLEAKFEKISAENVSLKKDLQYLESKCRMQDEAYEKLDEENTKCRSEVDRLRADFISSEEREKDLNEAYNSLQQQIQNIRDETELHQGASTGPSMFAEIDDMRKDAELRATKYLKLYNKAKRENAHLSATVNRFLSMNARLIDNKEVQMREQMNAELLEQNKCQEIEVQKARSFEKRWQDDLRRLTESSVSKNYLNAQLELKTTENQNLLVKVDALNKKLQGKNEQLLMIPMLEKSKNELEMKNFILESRLKAVCANDEDAKENKVSIGDLARKDREVTPTTRSSRTTHTPAETPDLKRKQLTEKWKGVTKIRRREY